MEKRTTILSEGAVADLTGCGKSLNRDDSPPQGLKPSLVLHDLRGAKAPLYHSAAGFRDFFRSLSKQPDRCLHFEVWRLRFPVTDSLPFVGKLLPLFRAGNEAREDK